MGGNDCGCERHSHIHFSWGLGQSPMQEKLMATCNFLCERKVNDFDLIVDHHPPPSTHSEENEVLNTDFRNFILTVWKTNQLRIHIKTKFIFHEEWETFSSIKKSNINTEFDFIITELKSIFDL
ncbi:MAG: hypothetical protein HOH79_04945 [Euryarchaeota archaeon]|jgi:hypothetical protein|nr:hypothetical protein [Euryarchaeota archaeon]